MNETQDLVKRTTLTALVAAYRESETQLREGFALLAAVQERLNAAFLSNRYSTFEVSEHHHRTDFSDPAYTLARFKKAAWRVLIERMELRTVLSIKRGQELDKQLETGEGLPDIDEKAILAMMEGTLSQVNSFIEESVREVYDYLRPRHDRYKTNSQFKVGKRVVLSYAADPAYSGTKFSVNYNRQKEITALDNVFHCLDGKGTVKTYTGPLSDAICASPDGRGETDYFRFKCFKNSNLHLEFKRADLVDQLNLVAGGGSLNRPAPAPAPATSLAII